MLRIRSALLASAPLLLLGLGTPADAPTFAPADDSTWERVLEERTTWIIDDVLMALDEVPLTFDVPDVQATNERTATLSAAVSVDDEGVARELRGHEDLEGSFSMTFDLPAEGLSGTYGYDLASPLEGEQVEFLRGAGGRLVAAWPDGADRDDALLRALSPQADLQALLPTEAVEEGDSWEVAAADAWTVFAAAGGLRFAPEDEVPGDQTVPVGALAAAGLLSFADLRGVSEELPVLDGTLAVTWKGTEQGDDRRLAELELELEGTFELDRDAAYAAVLEQQGLPEGDRMLRFLIDVEGAGVLLWDLDRNLAWRSELSFEFFTECSARWSEEAATGASEFTLELELSGESQLVWRRE